MKKRTTYAECLKRHKVAVHGTQGIYRKWDVLYVQHLTEDLVQNEAGVAFFSLSGTLKLLCNYLTHANVLYGLNF